MDIGEFRRASRAVSRLKPGPLRISRREDLVAAAERSGDPKFLAVVLLDLAWDHHEEKAAAPMAVAFARAWLIWQTRPEVFDRVLREKVRLVFPVLIGTLIHERTVPRAELDRLAGELERFYRVGGYSLRAVHRCRYQIHEAHGEVEQATACVEAMVAEPGDALSLCESYYQYVAAIWFALVEDWPRAAEACRAALIHDGACDCDPPHAAYARSVLMYCLLKTGCLEEAREQCLIGYPLVRGRAPLRRLLSVHMEYAIRGGDIEHGLRVVRDHSDVLTLGREAAEPDREFAGHVVGFLRHLNQTGRGQTQTDLADGRTVTADELLDELVRSAAGSGVRLAGTSR
jgi:hypothetical protein